MDLWSKMLSPWMNIRLPASGDVTMNYSPWTNWGWSDYEAGDPEMENEIFTNVALPGKQLGKLTDAVMALIEIAEKSSPGLEASKSEQAAAFQELKGLADRIASRKEELLGTAERNAEVALHRLKSADPKAYQRIIERERQEIEEL
jgi:hypothetical protein